MNDTIALNLNTAHDKATRRYNLRSTPVKYQAGQEVYRRNFALSNAAEKYNAKLGRKFLKSRVLRVVGVNRYELADLTGKFVGIYHAKDIRL